MYLNYQFKNIKLFKISMNHPSLLKLNKLPSYERMEFLGDSILNTILSTYVYKEYFKFSEGELSIVLSKLVNSKTIVKIANELKISNLIQMSTGEEKTGGRKKNNNLENAVEALIGSIYLDSNFTIVEKIVLQWWNKHITNLKIFFQKDNKTKLQELIQKKYETLPIYKIIQKIGLEHSPSITISLSIKGMKTVYASASTKKQAEQYAAKKILIAIQ